MDILEKRQELQSLSREVSYATTHASTTHPSKPHRDTKVKSKGKVCGVGMFDQTKPE